MNWISDAIARINNAILIKKESVNLRGTKIVREILEVMRSEGFIDSYESCEGMKGQEVKIKLKYSESDESVIRGIKVVSKPSLRKYKGSNDLRGYIKSMTCAIVSTPLGVMDNKRAIRENVGGEVLCEVR